MYFTNNYFAPKKEKIYYGPSPNTIPYFKTFAKINYPENTITYIENLEESKKETEAFYLGVCGTYIIFNEMFTSNYLPDSIFEKLNQKTNKLFPGRTYWNISQRSITTKNFFEIGNTLNELNEDLITTNKTSISAVFVTGSWIEALHITSTLALTTENNNLYTKVGELKITFEQILRMLEQHTKKNKMAKQLYTHVFKLSKIFAAVQINYNYKPPTIDKLKKTTIIETTSEVIITKDIIEKLAKEAKSTLALIQ